MQAYHYRHRVTFDETNVVGNVYFTQYLHWQGHCRERFIGDYAPGIVKDVQAGILALATVSCAMNYYMECFVLEEIDIAMTVTLRGKTSKRIVLDFVFSRDGQQVARGTQTVTCLQRTKSGVEPIDIPEELATAMAPFL